MVKEVIVLIDGNNLYHNLKVMHIKPSELDFDKFVKYICKHFDCSLKEAKYYNSIPDIREGKAKYYKHMSYMSEIGKIPKFILRLRKLQTSSTYELQKEKRAILENLELCNVCKPIMKKMCEDCIGRVKMKEKGIDVMIVVDMINAVLIDDKTIACILISGDGDFVPALEILKKKNREVFSASVVWGYARNLRQHFDCFIINKKGIIENCLKEKLEK